VAETWARWIAPLTVVSLTAWPGEAAALAERLRARFGLELAEAGRWTEAGDLACIWLAPDHWQIERAGAHDLAPDLAALAGPHGGVIDVTDARAALRIGGGGSRDLLARLLPLDLHPRAFAPHRAASTIAAHIGVQIRQIDATPTYDLACLRSYAESLRRAVEHAGAGSLMWR
jgi:heterotetrameric sarcosine oxidase gamma subunit